MHIAKFVTNVSLYNLLRPFKCFFSPNVSHMNIGKCGFEGPGYVTNKITLLCIDVHVHVHVAVYAQSVIRSIL